MPKIKIQLILKILIILSVLGVGFFIFFNKIDLTSLDLGRHIKNGEVIWQERQVLYENFYSFTEPNSSFINHHWLAGIIFYFLFIIGGFKLLSIFNILITLLTIGIVYRHAFKRSNFWLASLLILPVILIMSQRLDVRPEIFSYLFLVLTFFILDQFRRNNNYKKLFWLILIMLFWINLHIYFFLGLFLISLVLLEKFINYLYASRSILISLKKVKKLFYITALSYLVCLINPNFINGLLYPFNILKKYGYEIVENKSPLYLENLMINYNITIFKFLLLLLFISLISLVVFIIIRKKNNLNIKSFLNSLNIFYLILIGFFVFLAFFAIRNLPPFALIMLPIMAANFYTLKPLFIKIKKRELFHKLILILILILYISVIAWLIYDRKTENNFLKRPLGIGLYPGNQNSINFFKASNLKGPIFNNYDLGSALAFWLYPQEKIFVDNRPEAFSVDFMQTVYKPMQNSADQWNKYSEEYNINLIYFSHTDGTPWARKFVNRILNDKNWALIYFDNNIIILVKNNEKNQNLISKYKINQEKFKARLGELKINASNKNLFNLADLAMQYSENYLAEEIYKNILKKQPNNSQALALIGYLYSSGPKKEDIIKSLDYLNQALESGYTLPGIYTQMGLNYWGLLNYNEAVKMWEQALKIDKNNTHAKYYLDQAKELLD